MPRSILTTSGLIIVATIGLSVAQSQENSKDATSRYDRNGNREALVIPSIRNQFHGVVRASQMVELPSLVAGMIQEVRVREGQYVQKGDLLVAMDDRVPKARLLVAAVEANLTGNLKRAQVQLEISENRLERVQRVMKSGSAATFELETAEAERDQARANVEQQEDVLKAAEANRQLAAAQLEQFYIRAPFDGLVTEIHVKSGAVDPSQKVVTVANFDQLEVAMHMPSSMFGRIRNGATVSLKADRPISRNLEATVMSVSPIIDSASETFRCLLKLKNTGVQLPAGFSVVLNQQDSDTIPVRTAGKPN